MVWGCVSSFCFYDGSSGVLSGMPACVPFLVFFIWVLRFLVFVALRFGASRVMEGRLPFFVSDFFFVL